MALSSASRDTESAQPRTRVSASFLLDADVRDAVDQLAAAGHCSVGAVLRSLIADGFAYRSTENAQVAA